VYGLQHDRLVQSVNYTQSNLCFMMNWIRLKIYRRSLTVLYNLRCCWLIFLLILQLVSYWKYLVHIGGLSTDHRLSINRPKKRGKEKSPSDGHCQCQKEIDDHLACQQFLTESHKVTHLGNERPSFLDMNDINDISIFGTPDCHHCCSIA
jgi:hypothetical protein